MNIHEIIAEEAYQEFNCSTRFGGHLNITVTKATTIVQFNLDGIKKYKTGGCPPRFDLVGFYVKRERYT